MFVRAFLLLLLFVSASCGMRTIDDCRKEAEGVSRALLHVLEKIECRDDLLVHQAKLKKYFTKLAEVMIRAEEIRREGKTGVLYQGDPTLGERLRSELARVYNIAGGRELVEASQQEALLRLQALPDPGRVRLT